MQTPQNTKNNQLVAEHPKTFEVTYTPNKNSFFTAPENWTNQSLSNTPDMYTFALRDLKEYMLVTLGKHLATILAQIIDQLSISNREAINPIISIIKPYIETDQDLYVHMPPKSSREVIINITRQGKAKPKADLD